MSMIMKELTLNLACIHCQSPYQIAIDAYVVATSLLQQ